MAGTDSSRSSKAGPRKPLQVMHISRREQLRQKDCGEEQTIAATKLIRPGDATRIPLQVQGIVEDARFSDINQLDELSMAFQPGSDKTSFTPLQEKIEIHQGREKQHSYTVDEFDFDEETFLAALNNRALVGGTGEIITGTVITVDSDGIYVDIGGKAAGFMPKRECGLGVIGDLRECFLKGQSVEVLVTREQDAEGIVTVSCRALSLRKSWSRISEIAENGQTVQVKVNGFNRGGVTCDVEGLRGFIPRSQLWQKENYEALVGKIMEVAFLEVSSEARKLILSERRAVTVTRLSELKVGQLVEGCVVALKPYGLFVDLDRIIGLLHQSSITGGKLRSLRELFDVGDTLKAVITEVDAGRGRVSLSTVLLENYPGELLIDRDKVMSQATDRIGKARDILMQQRQSAE